MIAASKKPCRHKLKQILDSVVSRQSQVTEQPQFVEYNWAQPHYFNSLQLNKLDDFTKKLSEACSEKFTQHYHSDFNINIASNSQYFGGDFTKTGNSQKDYCLTFGPDTKQIFGFIGIPAKAAITWTTQLLGDNKPTGDSERDLSQLEKSLLLDIAVSVIDAFSNSYGADLCPAKDFIKGEIPIKFKEDDELCKISFNVEKAGSGHPSEVYFLIFCEKLEAVTGKKVEAGHENSVKDISKALHGHLNKVSVSITVQLASTEISFGEITNLNQGDIFILDKKVSSPVDLIIAGKPLLRGRLAKSEDEQAVVITELCNTK